MQEEKYEFIKEKRKEVPINKKKVALQTGYVCMMGLLFGVIASFVIAFLQPKIEAMLYPEQGSVVTIPEDEPTETSSTQSTETQTEIETEKLIEMLDWKPTLEDYQMLQNELYAIGQQANRFVVTVTGIQSETDWFNNDYEKRDQGSGIIIANNSQELLILTEKKIIVGAQEEEEGLVSVRSRFAGDEGQKSLDAFIDQICKEIRTKEIREEIPQEDNAK